VSSLEGGGEDMQTRVSIAGGVFTQIAVCNDDDDLIRKLECQKEFEDFTDESRQLEQELETTLIQNEKQIRDLNGMVISFREENEALRVSLTMQSARR
jgi:phage shock protein A